MLKKSRFPGVFGLKYSYRNSLISRCPRVQLDRCLLDCPRPLGIDQAGFMKATGRNLSLTHLPSESED